MRFSDPGDTQNEETQVTAQADQGATQEVETSATEAESASQE